VTEVTKSLEFYGQEGGGDTNMAWVKPEFKEVRMDAEINSYILVLE